MGGRQDLVAWTRVAMVLPFGQERLIQGMTGDSTMATNLNDLCKQQGISSLELADKAGLDLLRVRAICLGRWTPSPKERAKIAAVLNASVEDVSWGHTTPIQHIYGHGPG